MSNCVTFNPFTGTFDFKGEGGASTGYNTLSDQVPASSTKVIDTIALSSFFGLDYKLTIYNDANTVSRIYNLTIAKSGTTLKDKMSKVGDSISVQVNANVNGSDYELEIINNEPFALDIIFSRLQQ